MTDLTPYRVVVDSGFTFDRVYPLNSLVLLTDAQAKYPLLNGQIRVFVSGDDATPGPGAGGANETNTKLTISIGGVSKLVSFAQLIDLIPRLAGSKGDIGDPGPRGAQGVQGIQGAAGVVQSIGGVSKADISLSDLNLDKVANIAPADMPLSNPQAAAINSAIQNLLVQGGTGNPNIDIGAVAQAVAGKASNIDFLNHLSDQSNPHRVTKGQIGLSNVENLAPGDMPVSTATSSAIADARAAAITYSVATAAADASQKANAALQGAATLYAPKSLNVKPGGIVTGGGALTGDVTLTVTKATAADVAAGTDDTKAVTPLSLAPALGNRLRTDAPQPVNSTQAAQGLANLGIAPGIRSFLLSPDTPTSRATLGVVSSAGDTMTGKLTMAQVPIELQGTKGSAAPFIDFNTPNALRGRLIMDDTGSLIYRNGDTADNFFYVKTDGSVWTKQLGDLNTRIEQRVSDAKATSVAKTGDTMTGMLSITNTSPPTLQLTYSNKATWNMQARADQRLYFQGTDGTNVYDNFSIGLDGTVSTRQLGDLNTAINNAANTRISRYGDTMTGPLYIDYGYPQLQLTNRDGNGGFAYIDFCHVPYGHNDFTWRMNHNVPPNEWNVTYVDTGVQFAVRTDGSLWCRQLGDLNTRIENRCQAYVAGRVDWGSFTGDNIRNILINSGAGTSANVGSTIVARNQYGQYQCVDTLARSAGIGIPSRDGRVGGMRWDNSSYLGVLIDNTEVGISAGVSDARYKTNVNSQADRDELSKIEKIEFISFDWKEDSSFSGHRDLGVLAQDVQKIEPEWVIEPKDPSEGLYQLDMQGMLLSALRANQQLSAKLTALESRLAALEARS